MAVIIFPDKKRPPKPELDRYILDVRVKEQPKQMVFNYNDQTISPISASLSSFTTLNDVKALLSSTLSVVDSTFDPSTAEDNVFYFVKK